MATNVQCGALSLLGDLGLDPHGSPWIAAVKQGLSVSVFTSLATALHVSEATLADASGISVSTLTRRKRAGRLAPHESEHVLRIALLLDRAARLFGDVDDAAAWLTSPNPSLGGATPLAFADTEPGGREVEDLLGRIEYGVYS